MRAWMYQLNPDKGTFRVGRREVPTTTDALFRFEASGPTPSPRISGWNIAKFIWDARCGDPVLIRVGGKEKDGIVACGRIDLVTRNPGKGKRCELHLFLDRKASAVLRANPIPYDWVTRTVRPDRANLVDLAPHWSKIKRMLDNRGVAFESAGVASWTCRSGVRRPPERIRLEPVEQKVQESVVEGPERQVAWLLYDGSHGHAGAQAALRHSLLETEIARLGGRASDDVPVVIRSGDALNDAHCAALGVSAGADVFVVEVEASPRTIETLLGAVPNPFPHALGRRAGTLRELPLVVRAVLLHDRLHVESGSTARDLGEPDNGFTVALVEDGWLNAIDSRNDAAEWSELLPG